MLYDLSDFLEDCTEDIRHLRKTRRADWTEYTPNEKLAVARGVQIAELMQDMADFHVLTEDAMVKESLVRATKHAREVIHQLGA